MAGTSAPRSHRDAGVPFHSSAASRPLEAERNAGGGERGIGLFEVMAGTVIATLAVLGLAYSFGIGRGLIDRYQMARAALAEAQGIVDSLATHVPSPAIGTGSRPFNASGIQAGTIQWTTAWVDDPADQLSPTDPNPQDMKRVTVTVSWSLATANDRLALTRLIAK